MLLVPKSHRQQLLRKSACHAYDLWIVRGSYGGRDSFVWSDEPLACLRFRRL